MQFSPLSVDEVESMARSAEAECSAVNAAAGDNLIYMQTEKEARVDAKSLGSSQYAELELLSQPAGEAASPKFCRQKKCPHC